MYVLCLLSYSKSIVDRIIKMISASYMQYVHFFAPFFKDAPQQSSSASLYVIRLLSIVSCHVELF